MLLVAVLALLFAYVGTYYRLSRRGIPEAMEHSEHAFAYVPIGDIDSSVPTRVFQKNAARHFTLCVLFAPLNWLDRKLFGAPEPFICLMRLSG
jgi:hypothetical protein